MTICSPFPPFRSYKGHQVIGPFKQFTSIIGPNGSGKSNLMDAISFVLGVQSAQLRGAALRDLVYSFDLADKDERRTAYVKLVYETEDGVEIVFSRHITAAGTGEYRVDGKACPAEAYNDRLKSFGILVKARNFLVFQGDIESVASKSPKELTALIEQISGSEDVKKDYEEALRQRHKAEEDQHAAFTKRKTLSAQRKQMREQKEEAERHARMTEELHKLRVEHVLFKLFHIDFDAQRHADEIAEAEEELREHEAKVEAVAREMEEKRQAKAARVKEVLVLERKIANRRAEVDGKAPSAVRTKEEIFRAKKKIELTKVQLGRYADDAETSAAEIARLERDLKNVEAAESAFEKELEKKGKKAALELGESQMREYNAKKEEAGAKTFKLRQEREGFANRLQADEESRARLAGKREELEKRSAALVEARDDEMSRLATLESTAAAAQTEMVESRNREKQLENEKRKARAKQEHLTNKIEELSGKLREAKADRKESERETRALEAITAMKRLLPGVHGRVTDLMKVSQKKYNLAVITVLGKEADAVVVEDSKTAKECVQYLKEQRVAPMTFLPLKEIKVHEPDEALRRLGGTAKLCLDVVNYDSAVSRAMIYALGNDTVVCDAHAEAKKITFGGDRRFKVVSLDGTMIKKSGEMTGGSSGSLEAKASRFDAEEVEQLRADRQAAEEGLARLRPVAALQEEEHEAVARLVRLERDAQYYAVDIKMATEKIEKFERDAANIERALAETLPQLEAAERACEKSRAAVKALDEKVHAVEDEVYASFSKSVGVENIREYEAHNLQQLQRSAEERAKFTQQRAKLTEQLNFERSRDVEGPKRRAEAEIAKCEAELKRLGEAAENARAASENAKTSLEGWERAAVAAKAEANAVDVEIRDLRERHSSLSGEGAKTQRVIANKTAAVEALREQRADIIAASRMERLKLPRAENDETDDDDETLALPAPESAGDGDAMDTDESNARDVEHASAWRENAFKLKLNYDGLPQRLKQAPRPSDRERLDDELRAESEAKAAALAKLEPNMKAIDQYESVKERERAQAEDLEHARRRAKDAQESFDSLKNERTSTFMAAFEHIAAAIDRVYKELTQSESHPLGGTAYLSLESPEEPYNHGVKFTAMPPTKRFRDMEQLSGGEKTMAALALLFAIHSYRSSPFFILDEVDAALDKTNVEKMAAFIKSRSHGTGAASEGNACQSIVISLKDYFFDKADSLVGVSRDVEGACSKVLTFDLTEYEE
jgi:structural maintenance of chromosome 1